MGAKEIRLPACLETLLELEELRANLAENLGAFLSVVEVEIGAWRATAGTVNMYWNR